jgi:AraC family ethanolamine operon transcriptional activator
MEKSVSQAPANHLTILHHRFNDVDQMAETMNSNGRRQIQLSQLSPQQFQCGLLSTGFDEAQIIFMETSCPLRGQGDKVGGYLEFDFILEASKQLLIAHGSHVDNNTLYGFDPKRHIDVVLPPDLILCSVQIKQVVFEEYLQIMGRSDIDQRFLATNLLRAPILLLSVRTYLKQLRYLAEQQAHLLKLPHLKKLVLEDLIPLLIDAIPRNHKITKPSLTVRRAQMVKQAEDYMLANLDQPLTLKDICKALHISSRPLFYGFQELFGLSPMSYLKVQRLNQVRRSLKVADPVTSSVMSIASRYGFWSAGHFARDYRQMFGELPSETMKQ